MGVRRLAACAAPAVAAVLFIVAFATRCALLLPLTRPTVPTARSIGWNRREVLLLAPEDFQQRLAQVSVAAGAVLALGLLMRLGRQNLCGVPLVRLDDRVA
jgi:hypothetical protein